MPFVAAVQSVFRQYVGFSGRAGRPEYWWFFLFTVIVDAVAYLIDEAIGTSVIRILLGLALLLPTLAVAMRRLHDIDRTGWWLFIALVPLIGAIVLIVFYCLPGTPGPNRYGPPAPLPLTA